MKLPRYPIYIPSKGRFQNCLTAKWLDKEGIPFRLVVEAAEREEYEKRFGPERVLVLPFSDAGSVIPARNWIKAHATEERHERHWQLDDNIKGMQRWQSGKRVMCDPGPGFAACEDFTDRYENIAITGIEYSMFCIVKMPPIGINLRVYSASLINNAITQKWRGRYNEDTDLCLQVLAAGWCTVLVRVFMVMKQGTMKMKGGNTTALYGGDGRLKMARALERLWPRVVTINRRYKRPQHVVYDYWKRFDTPLKLKPGIDLDKLPPDEYGLKLVTKAPVKSPALRAFVRKEQRRQAGLV